MIGGIIEDWDLIPKEQREQLTDEEIEKLEQETIERLQEKIDRL